MTLELEAPALDSDENPELEDFRRRFFWTLPLTVTVAALSMVGHRIPWPGVAMENWIEFGLSVPIVLWAGAPFFMRAGQSLIHRSPNMWTLIGLGTSAAFLDSVLALAVPAAFPAAFMVMGRVPVYFEAAAVIISLTLLGLSPKTARRINPADGDAGSAFQGAHAAHGLRRVWTKAASIHWPKRWWQQPMSATLSSNPQRILIPSPGSASAARWRAIHGSSATPR